MEAYGKELILDLYNCNPEKFTRKYIKRYFVGLCELIDMKREKLTWWDDFGLDPEECQTKPHLKGTTAVQFILTSNITIHALDILKRVYVNVFSCKEFDHIVAALYTEKYFEGQVANKQIVRRV